MYGSKRYTSRDIKHIKLWHSPNATSLLGEGPIQRHKSVLRSALDLHNYSDNWFRTAAVPTGTRWHLEKNAANRYGAGARIGSKVEFQGYAPSAAPGTMLDSVKRGSIEQFSNGFSVSFGWLNKQEKYFGQQDLGTYRPNGVGMGLLNKGNNGGRDMGAALAAEAELLKKMKSARFKVKGSFF